MGSLKKMDTAQLFEIGAGQLFEMGGVSFF